MIEFMRGMVTGIQKNKIIIETHDIGYGVIVSEKVSKRVEIGKDVGLLIFDLIKEADRKLFGFFTVIDKKVFEFLLKVDGVGPLTAIRIMDGIDSPDILLGISRGEMCIFEKVHGIGSKTIQKIAESGRKVQAVIDQLEEKNA